MDGLNGASLLVDLDAGFAARQGVLENRRRVVSWAKDYVEEVASLGFAVTVDVDGADLLIRVADVQEQARPVFVAAPHPSTQDLADLAAALHGDADDVPAQEAHQTTAAETGGGGEAEQVAATPAAPEAAANVLPLVGYGTPWSDAEDAALIAGVVEGMMRGLSMRQASLRQATTTSRRTPATVEQRARVRLRERIEAALADKMATVVETPEFRRLPAWQRNLSQALDRIGNDAPFLPAADLVIVEGLAMGLGTEDIAVDLGLSKTQVRDRFALLCPEKTIAAQQNLLTELRRRAGMEEGARA